MSSPSNAFHLRPAYEKRRSATSDSPTASSSGSSPTAEKGTHMKTFREGDSSVVLRDLDLDTTLRGQFPNLPAPPTGHDLMAMFPAPAPSFALPPNRRTEATSGYFLHQERAYFAQAGKEIIKVRVDVDVRDRPIEVDERNHDEKRRVINSKRDEEVQRQLHQLHSPRVHPEASPQSQREIHARQSVPTLRRMSVDNSPHPHPVSPPKSRYGYPSENDRDPRELRLAPTEYSYAHPEETDEAWRRPTPYAERRRAGKHTRRVIVKN